MVAATAKVQGLDGTQTAKAEIGSLIGASLLSAAGSLPLHLMPLIVVTLIADARTSVAQAGWVASSVLIGQLLASLALPVLKIDTVRRRITIAAAFALLLALLATVIEGLALLLIGWALVGACCGLFQYVGTTTASGYFRPVFAFSLRLGIVLVLAGTVAGALQGSNAFASYGSILIVLCAIFGLVLCSGLALYRPGNVQAPRPRQAPPGRSTLSQIAGLGTVFLLFVGQTGFLTYAVQGAVGRGMALADAAWAVAGMKVIAGIALLLLARGGLQEKQRTRFLELGLLLAASLVAIAYAGTPAVFFLGLLGFELGLNILAARLQGKVVEAAPQFAGRWLTGTILLGAAAGPALHGVALGISSANLFLYVAVGSALIPALWASLRSATNQRAQATL